MELYTSSDEHVHKGITLLTFDLTRPVKYLKILWLDLCWQITLNTSLHVMPHTLSLESHYEFAALYPFNDCFPLLWSSCKSYNTNRHFNWWSETAQANKMALLHLHYSRNWFVGKIARNITMCYQTYSLKNIYTKRLKIIWYLMFVKIKTGKQADITHN